MRTWALFSKKTKMVFFIPPPPKTIRVNIFDEFLCSKQPPHLVLGCRLTYTYIQLHIDIRVASNHNLYPFSYTLYLYYTSWRMCFDSWLYNVNNAVPDFSKIVYIHQIQKLSWFLSGRGGYSEHSQLVQQVNTYFLT